MKEQVQRGTVQTDGADEAGCEGMLTKGMECKVKKKKEEESLNRLYARLNGIQLTSKAKID